MFTVNVKSTVRSCIEETVQTVYKLCKTVILEPNVSHLFPANKYVKYKNENVKFE